MALYGDGSNVNKTTSASIGTYGSASQVPTITVDGNQRISSINQTSITLDASINANASVGAVGTYAFLQQTSANAGAVAPGGTVAGSSMRYSDATGRDNGTGPSGNWRCMGYDSGTPRANTSNTGSASASASGNVTGSLQGGQVQGNASLQGGEVQGNASLQGGEVQGNASLQGGNVQGNTNANGSLGIGPHSGLSTKGGMSVPTNHLGVGGNVGTNGLNVGGNVGTSGLNVAGNVGTSGLDVSGNVTGTASINVSVNSVSANVTVAYSSTLWLRYS